MVYNGYFGKGNNVIYNVLRSEGLFNGYPYELTFNKSDFIKVLELGKKDVQNIIIN